jgi:hypothetical protein
MSFELTTDEALMVYEAIADHAWDSDLGKLATRIYARCYPNVAPDTLLKMSERAIFTLFPSIKRYEGAGDKLEVVYSWISRKEAETGRRTIWVKLIRPILEYLSNSIPVTVEPTHFDMGIDPEENGWRVTVWVYKL